MEQSFEKDTQASQENVRAAWLYLLPVLAVPILMCIAAFLIVPTNWLILRSGNVYMANMGYGAKLHNADCQVLIFGDSTALVGIDPKIITQQTGLTACNIAEFVGMTRVSGTRLVDRYLANNPRPKYMVFMYAPENMNRPDTWNNIQNFEAITYRAREDHSMNTALALALHPVATAVWVEQGLRLALVNLRSRPMADEKTHVRERDLGQLKLLDEPEETRCRVTPIFVPPDPAWVAQLHSYAVDGTKVILDATPVMPCDASLADYRTHLVGVVDNLPLQLYPPTDYVAGGQRLHMNAKGSAKVSAMLAAQIRALQEGH